MSDIMIKVTDSSVATAHMVYSEGELVFRVQIYALLSTRTNNLHLFFEKSIKMSSQGPHHVSNAHDKSQEAQLKHDDKWAHPCSP